MKIFRQIKNSIYNREYYKEIVMKETFGQSIKYLVKVCVLIAVILSLIITGVIPLYSGKIKSSFSEAINSYPDDLTITILKGEASINKPVPYIYKLPAGTSTNSKLKYENLIVIDTDTSFNIDKYKEYSTYALLSKTEIVYPDQNSDSLKITALSKFGNVVITQDWLREKEGIIIKYLPLALPFIFVFLFIGFFLFNFIGELIILIIYALITWLVLRIKGIKTSYQRAYQVSTHAVTLILILFMVSIVVSAFGNFFVKILVLAIVVIVNFDKPDEMPVIAEPIEILPTESENKI